MELLQQAIVIFVRDLRTEARAPKVLATMAFFSLIVLLLFVFGIDPIRVDAKPIFPTILWTGIFFSGTIGLSRIFESEASNGCFDGLLIAPVSRAGIYFAKLGSSLLFAWMTSAVMVPLLFILFEQPLLAPLGSFCGLIALVSLGFVTVGTLVSAITAQTGESDVLMPVLLFPLTVPLILAAVELTGALLSNGTFQGSQHWLYLVLGYDLLFVVLSPVLFEFLVEVQ